MKQLLLIPIVILLFSFNDVAASSFNSLNNQGVVHESKITVYPNPVYSNNFQIKSDKEIKKVKVTNIVGQQSKIKVVRKSYGQIEVVFNNKKQGIYLVTVEYFDNQKEVKKMIVK